MLPEMGAWRAVILLNATIIVEAQKIKKINGFHNVCLFCCGREVAVVVLRHYLLLLRVTCPAPWHCMLSDNVITTRMEHNKKNYLSVHPSTRSYVLRSTISIDVIGRLKCRNMKYPGTIPIFSYSSTSTSIALLPS